MTHLYRALGIFVMILMPLSASAVTGSLSLSASGMPSVTTIELAMTAAQTNTAIVAAVSGQRPVVTAALYDCANSNTVDVAVRIGLAASTTPTTTGVFLSHPGIPPGGGLNRIGGIAPLAIGASGDAILITSTVPTTGSCRAVITYYMIGS